MVAPPERLRDMPLHAITEALGESGLRERFALEITRFDPSDQSQLTAALALVSELHRDDRRVSEPYLNHLLRVATRMACHYEVRDPEVIAAGLLHDAVEDHALELAQAAPPGSGQPNGADGRSTTATGVWALRTLTFRFGTRVANLVAAVTNPDYVPGRDPDQQYLEHVAASLDRSPWARVIKISDFTDNGVGIIHTVGPKALRAASKYRPLVPVLRELVARPDTPLSYSVKRHISQQLDLAEQRFGDILDRHTR
jgi:hypothetical protein